MPTRNRFRSYGAPLRTSGVAETQSQRLAREAGDLRNQRTIDELSDPTRKLIEQLQLQDLLTKLTDPYVKFVADLNRHRQEAQDRDALGRLAEGDPFGFVRYAQDRLKGMTEDDMGYSVWSGLLQKAEERIEDEQWASDIETGAATYEEFREFLITRMNQHSPGSVEASEVAFSISELNNAIKAREESAKDQTAYVEYINTSDHKKYMLYLQNKLSRTMDPQVAGKLVENIQELSKRAAMLAESERRHQVASIYNDFRGNKISGAEARTRLINLGKEQLTPSEVTAIQTTIHSIAQIEQQAGESARAGRQQEIASRIAVALKDYNQKKREIDSTIADDRVPDPEKLAAFAHASESLSEAYGILAETASTPESARTWATTASTILKDLEAIPALVSEVILKEDITSEGNGVFQERLKTADGLPDRQVDLIQDRIRNLKKAVADPRLMNVARTEAQKELERLTAQGEGVLRDIINTKREPTPDEEFDLNRAYLHFATTVGKDVDKRGGDSFATTQGGKSDFYLAVMSFENPDEFAAHYNLPPGSVDPVSFENYKKYIGSVYRVNRMGQLEFSALPDMDQRGVILGNDTAKKAGETALKKAKEFLTTVGGSSPILGDNAVWEYIKGATDLNGFVTNNEQQRQLVNAELQQLLSSGGRRGGPDRFITQEPLDENQQAISSAPQGQPLAPIGSPMGPSGPMGADPMMTGFENPMMNMPQLQPRAPLPDLELALPESDDPIQKALGWLNSPVNLGLPGFSLPNLPEMGPFMPVLSEYNYGDIQLPGFDGAFPEMDSTNTGAPIGSMPGVAY